MCELCALLDQISQLGRNPQLESFRLLATVELRSLIEVGSALLRDIDAALKEASIEESNPCERFQSDDSL